MRQAITTKFLGPTNSRGARVKAVAEAGSVTVNWDYSLGIEGNHTSAAKALAAKLEWDGVWFGGGLTGNGYVFVWTGDTLAVSGHQVDHADFVIPKA